MTKTVKFYDECDELVLTKKITGLNIGEIEKKSHNILTESDNKTNKYYNLYLQSFHIVNWNK